MPVITRIVFFLSLLPFASVAQNASAQAIIQRSVAANARDFEAASLYSHKERQMTSHGPKEFLVEMMEGSPYQRLLSVNNQPLSPEEQASEKRREDVERSKRQAENPQQRSQRIARFQKDRMRDQKMLNQLTEAFNFSLLGEEDLNGFRVYHLKATPRPGYNPPNMETQVLPAMEGELWIDQRSSQWVKVIAKVIRPASIEGFLAQVQPGTRFELDKKPVTNEVWFPSHFTMSSQAKVLFLVPHSSSDDETYFDYVRAGS